MLGSNEAIAGLDSPAMAMTLPRNPLGGGAASSGEGNGAFNWLQCKMNDLQIGGEKKVGMAAAVERGAINRNATVFQVIMTSSCWYFRSFS